MGSEGISKRKQLQKESLTTALIRFIMYDPRLNLVRTLINLTEFFVIVLGPPSNSFTRIVL
jgi:hypothetical protein